jgi:hypothetical protein
VELRGALDCTEAGGETDELGPIPGSCAKDAVDANAPADPDGTEGTEAGAAETGSGEAEGEGEPEPTAGGSPAGSIEEPQTDPATDAVTDPATGGEPAGGTEDEEVLGELNGIISDLFE